MMNTFFKYFLKEVGEILFSCLLRWMNHYACRMQKLGAIFEIPNFPKIISAVVKENGFPELLAINSLKFVQNCFTFRQ